MKLTKQQQSVMDRILYFLESDASVFVLKGWQNYNGKGNSEESARSEPEKCVLNGSYRKGRACIARKDWI